MPENRPVNARLDSWKEIADYLKRDVRTVIRWEQEKALPVHRVPGGRRQAVFAYTQEIDAWLVGQPTNGNHSSQPAAEAADVTGPEPDLLPSTEIATVPASEARPGPRRILKFKAWQLVAALALLVGLIWITGAMLVRSRGPVTLRVLGVHKLTDDGRLKGSLRTDGTTLYFNQTEGARGILMSAPLSGSPARRIDISFPNVTFQDLSSDGKKLLISSPEGSMMDGPLWAIPVQGGTPLRVSDTICDAARWSPDTHKIACAAKTAITVMGADGSHAHTVAPFSRPVGNLLWSPDGGHLRFNVQDNAPYTASTWEIELLPDGTATPAKRLPMGTGCCVDWIWTRDGKTFVYIEVDSNAKSHLMVQTEKSSRATELPVNIGILRSVTSGKSSDTLYLMASTADRGELLRFNAEQKAWQTFIPGLSAAYVAFSPDGKWISYSDPAGDSLWRSRADGSEALQLVKPDMEVEVSSWSPDGQRIAFMRRQPGKPWRIYLIGRDGGEAVEASEGDDNQGGPSWSPDGKEIVYGNVICENTNAQNCLIRRLKLATRKTEILPGSNGMRTARWSPDDKYIAALRFQTHELMLFDLARQRWRMLADSVKGDNINWSSDSQYIYVDSPRDEKPMVERVRVEDGQREIVVSLSDLEKVLGQTGPWIGLTPDNSPILCHLFTASEIYELKWTDR